MDNSLMFQFPVLILIQTLADASFHDKSMTTKMASAQQRVEELKTLGKKHYASKRFKEAIDAFTAALALDPREKTLYGNRSAAYCKLEMHEEALADADKAVSLDDQNPRAYMRRATAFFELGQLHHALVDFQLVCSYHRPSFR